MHRGGNRYTDRYTAVYRGYTINADAVSLGMSARFACCGGYTAILDAQIEELLLARLHQMLLLRISVGTNILFDFGEQR